MAARIDALAVTDDSKVGPLLDNANVHPVLLEKDGIVYQLSRVDEEWFEPDPERVAKILDESFGVWADIDADAFIAELYEARERGSRPWDRPDPIELP